MEWSLRSAEELTAALRAREVSAVELTDDVIARIERDDEVINAICVADFDRARGAARDADRTLARGEDRPLLGVPVTVTESYDVAGLPTTWGMPAHRDHVPAEDAVQVSRVKAAGAVILGKTNVPLGLQGIQSPGGLPIGVQILGPALEDRTPLRLAELLEQRTGQRTNVELTMAMTRRGTTR